MTTEQYSIGYEAGHTDGWNEAVDNLSKPPAPDCRTCWFLHTSDHGDDRYECTSKTACTNGDQYKTAPSVVLWRTI